MEKCASGVFFCTFRRFFAMLQDRFHRKNDNIGHRTVTPVCRDCGYFVNDIQSLDSLSEDSILPVKLAAGILILNKVELGT